MDNFEDNGMHREADAAQPVQENKPQEPAAPAGNPAGRDAAVEDSPYAGYYTQGQSSYYTYPDGGGQNPYAQGGYASPMTYPAPPVKQKVERQGSSPKTALCISLAAVMVAVGCGITGFTVNAYWHNRAKAMADSMNNRLAVLQEQITQMGQQPGTQAPGGQTVPSGVLMTPAQVYAQNVQAVVAISNETTTNIYGQITSTASAGSGFILTEDGYVVSNYHVIEGATHLGVLTADGQEYEATVVGYDKTNDISLLKIEASGLPRVTLGRSDDLIVGDQVVAIGNPLGELTSTLTVGYISAKDRMVNTEGVIINMLQTDAAINPGNSGGPLFNMYGEVIGITTAKYSGTSSSGASIEGLGFAIPIDDVSGMLDDLLQYGYVTGAYLGVSVRSMDSTISQTYGLPMGAYVESVTVGSCAELAGIRAKDIITNLGGYEITSVTDLTRALRKFKAGDETTVEVFRGGKTEYLTIKLDEKPRSDEQPKPSAHPSQPEESGYEDEWWYNFLPPFFGRG